MELPECTVHPFWLHCGLRDWGRVTDDNCNLAAATGGPDRALATRCESEIISSSSTIKMDQRAE